MGRRTPLVWLAARALDGVAVLFRDAEAVATALAKAGLLVVEIRVLPALGKALTPWGGPLRWPMGLSPLRDVMVVARPGPRESCQTSEAGRAGDEDLP